MIFKIYLGSSANSYIYERRRQITVSISFNTLQNEGKNVVLPSLYFVNFLTYKKCVRGFILLTFSFGESSIILAEKTKTKQNANDCFVDPQLDN